MFDGARFGPFELDLGRRQLRKHGIRLRLPDQSFVILAMLVERAGELVSREQIRDRLWPNGTIVEFEHSINSAVKRLRDALGDSGPAARFIETVPKRGYRFCARIEPHGRPAGPHRYRILGEAGRGAMGIVYRAEDVRLGRAVALKFVPDELATDPAALERLRREARMAAVLNHPGICTLYGLEDHEDRPCLVMEYLEGTPLSRTIEAGPLEPARAIEIAIEVCAALAAAHEKGIIHRDIKPGNLFVTAKGTVKLTDFGIAARAGDTATPAGGTPSYSSPEQSRGGTLDARSDIFSLGAVLYETITGRRMFPSGQRTPPPSYPPGVSTAVRAIIARAAAADPADRFQSAAEMMAALERARRERNGGGGRRLRGWMAIAALIAVAVMAGIAWKWGVRREGRPEIRAIAVLPLVNLSGQAGQEYLADGITEELTSDLAELGDLRVISRTSAMTYKGSSKTLAEIAARLKVDAVVEGSVSRSGPRVRVVAQLIQASTDTHLWSRTYERDIADVLRLQADLAQSIAREIRVALTPERRARLTGRRPVKPQAYEAYLKGMFHLNKFTPEGFELGTRYLQQAIDQDPADPNAYAALALGYAIMGHDRFPDAFAQAKAAARKSLQLGGPVPEAYAVLGMAELYSDWEFEAGGRDLRRALDLNPNLAEARRSYAWYLELTGRGKDALFEMSRAVDLEPLMPIFPADLAWQELDQGYFDAALVDAAKALELDPKFAQALAIEGWAYLEKGMDREAVTAHRKAAEADSAWKWPLARTYALVGKKAEARAMAAEIAKQPGPMDQWGLAAIYAALGEREDAFRRLDEAYKERFSFLPWDHIPDMPSAGGRSDLFGPLRSDPRFGEMGRRIGLR